MAATTKARPGHPLFQQNLLDRAIAYFDPKRAQQRMMARGVLALAGGYNGARRDKAQLSSWNPGSGSPTTDAVADLPMLRDRSRDEMRNSGVAAGAINGAITGTVGTGLSANPVPDHELLGISLEEAKTWARNTRRRFETWAASTDCDVARTCDFYDLQSLAMRSWLESGDAFVLTPRMAHPGRPTRLALQLIEGDRCCNPNRTANTPTLIEGVELDPVTQAPVRYHFARHHPGDYFAGGNTWDARDAYGTNGRRNVLHLFTPLRPGQVRGMPWLAPILEPLKQLDRWTENELNAAVTSSIFSVFAKMDPQAFQDIFDGDGESESLIKERSKWTGELGSGKAINLLPGEELGSVSSSRPNPLFDPFWTAMVRQIGMALEIPFEVLVMHFQSSYSAARGALLMAWKFFKARRDLLATKLCQPTYELWLALEVSEGRRACPGFFASPEIRAAWCNAIWTGDGPGSVDPQKEVSAARDRVEMEISTLDAESILHDGIDFATKHKQRTKEIAMQKRDGTYVAKAGAPVQPTDAADATNPAGDGSDDDTETPPVPVKKSTR